METAGLILIALAVILVALSVAMWRGVASAEPWAKYAQGVITSTAIILAGYLYFVERRSKPHADVTQTVEAVSVGEGVVAIEASVIVKNLGTQLLTIDHVVSRLQVIDLRPLGVDNLPKLKGPDYWKAKNATGRDVFLGPEMRWRQVRLYDSDEFWARDARDRFEHKIEPGESDLTTISFVIPCPKNARHIRVATEVGNPATGISPVERIRAKQVRDKAPQPDTSGPSATANPADDQPQEMFWKARTTVHLEPICAPKDQQKGEAEVQPTIKA